MPVKDPTGTIHLKETPGIFTCLRVLDHKRIRETQVILANSHSLDAAFASCEAIASILLLRLLLLLPSLLTALEAPHLRELRRPAGVPPAETHGAHEAGHGLLQDLSHGQDHLRKMLKYILLKYLNKFIVQINSNAPRSLKVKETDGRPVELRASFLAPRHWDKARTLPGALVLPREELWRLELTRKLSKALSFEVGDRGNPVITLVFGCFWPKLVLFSFRVHCQPPTNRGHGHL